MELTWDLILFLIIVGIVVGALKTAAGAGGGVFFVSFLVLYFGMPFDEARDTSIFIMLIGSSTGFAIYLKQKRTNVKIALIFSMFTIMGALICWVFIFFVPLTNDALKSIFGVVLITIAGSMFVKLRSDKKNLDCSTEDFNEEFSLENYELKKNLKKAIPFLLLSGFAANLLGIGGGVINTPVCNLVLGIPIHNATAISTGVIFFTTIFNVVPRFFIGKINYIIGIYLAVGTVIGAIFGAKISDKMPKAQLQAFVAILIIFLGVNMLFSLGIG